MKKKVIVIGGGIAGLSAGVYAQRCGFDVTILETHNIAGGNCTSWKRRGYSFEGGMHWLAGSNKNEQLNKSWRHIGALDDNVQVHYYEPFFEYNYEGTPIRMYRDVERTEKHLIALSPEDEAEIKTLTGNIRKVKNLAMPVTDIHGVKTTKKSRPSLSLIGSGISALSLMNSFSKISKEDYIKRFKHEGIRDLLRSCISEKSGVLPLFFTMGSLARGDGGFPEGGSAPFVERIVKTFTGFGGEILYNTRADHVVIEDGKATGVVVGEKWMPADAVIVTADTMTVESLFKAPLKAPWLDEMRKATLPTMCVFISFGISANLSKYPHGSLVKLNSPIRLADEIYEFLNVNNYATDPTYSPEGKSALTVTLDGDTYDFWKKAKDENQYKEEKQKIADEVLAGLAEQMPEIKGNVEVIDVATPLTYERYCGNWKGSWMTEMTSKMKMKSYPADIPGLSGVYFAGQRMMPPGGFPPALLSGRAAVQYLCRDTGTLFISES